MRLSKYKLTLYIEDLICKFRIKEVIKDNGNSCLDAGSFSHSSNDNCNNTDAQCESKCLYVGILEGPVVYLG